jgi:hypothetical protein
VSGISDADLVPVRSHDELRAGPMFERRCVSCRKDHWVILLHRGLGAGTCDYHGGLNCPRETSWFVVGCLGGEICFEDGLVEGRLFRLRDLDDAEEEGRRIACDIDDRRRATVRMHAEQEAWDFMRGRRP